MLIFVAAAAPNLVSSDLRNHTLPLYFSRPISRTDYPAGQAGRVRLALLAMIEIPLLMLYLGNVSQAHGANAVWAQTLQLGPGLLYGAAWAVLLASIGLLLASPTGKRVFAICAIGIPSVLHLDPGQCAGERRRSGVPAGCVQASRLSLASLAGLISPFTLLGGVLRWLQGNPGNRPGRVPQQATSRRLRAVYGAGVPDLDRARPSHGADRPLPEVGVA